YDVAGWTLPLQMGVKAVALGSRYSGDFEDLERIEPKPGTIQGVENPEYLTFQLRTNDDIRVLNALTSAGIEVYQLDEALQLRTADGKIYSKPLLQENALLVKPTPESRAALARVLPKASTMVEGVTGVKDKVAYIETPDDVRDGDNRK